MLAQLKATKFDSIQALIDTLFASNLVFAIDSETKEDIYILNTNKAKNQSERYGISRDKQGKYYLDKKED